VTDEILRTEQTDNLAALQNSIDNMTIKRN